jgi:hypothetical protein
MPSWTRQLDNAKSAAQVVSIARDYFALWAPEEIARLPVGCRPPHLRDAADIEELHRAAVGEYRKARSGRGDLTLLQQLTGITAQASMRLAQLREEGDDELSDSQLPRQPTKKAGESRNP